VIATLVVVLPRLAHAEALLVVEADSGKVLEAQNATYPWYPASVTKLMKCLACEDVRPMTEGAFTCACGRSAAVVEGPVVELQGPARILVPADVETHHEFDSFATVFGIDAGAWLYFDFFTATMIEDFHSRNTELHHRASAVDILFTNNSATMF